jgi:hypothetical protein
MGSLVSEAAHALQKRASSAFSLPQFGQTITPEA